MTGILTAELRKRWRAMFEQLRDGRDLPPSRRLRAEGLMEAAVLAGEASAAQLQDAMAEVYREVYGHPLSDDFGLQWRDFFEFPQIPGVMRRAPVWPSTRD